MNKYFLFSCTFVALTTASFAQINEVTCEPLNQRALYTQNAYKHIYPFKPLDLQILDCRMKRLTESTNFVSNLKEIDGRNLQSANTRHQPWGGTYWPLMQGLIANDYQNKHYNNPLLTAREFSSWKVNHKKYLKRTKKVHPRAYELSEKELAELAPSEKYDLLLGDTSFDLTNRVWNYAATWGKKNKWGFLSSIVVPDGYRIPNSTGKMESWEGICHGWAVAAGHYPRPHKTVWVKLKNGKNMPFYPTDLKALISLLWANSNVQDAVLTEGLRCNTDKPEKDEHGRYIDRVRDLQDKSLLPRCADVHPAVYHTAIVNILGLEGRSFVVDTTAESHVSNQPVSGYVYRYFNPKDGKEGTLEASALSVDAYPEDPFKDARNKATRYIVGIDMTLKYVALEKPKATEINDISDDVIKDMNFNYDLELDANFNIVGGQWRVKKDGSSRVFRNNTNQPDFFWVVPRDYKKHFTANPYLPAWDFTKSPTPPVEYQSASKVAHGFVYKMTAEFGWNEKCEVLPKKGKGEMKLIPCEFEYPKPQPLINVVETLVQESRR